jgi:hypothetical protein
MSDFNKNFLENNIPDSVFLNFDRTASKLLVDNERGGGDINFLGVHIPLSVDALRHQGEYWSGRTSNYWPDDPSLPSPFHEDYFEYVDLLYSICKSDKHFQMAEVGAGYGRWILNAAAAIKRCIHKKIASSFFLGFEADPDRINFFHKMMEINKIEKKSYKLIEKIVSEKNTNNTKLPFIINKKGGGEVWRNDN